jgi:hypothetical protein
MPWWVWCALVVGGVALLCRIVLRRVHHYTELSEVLAPLICRDVEIGVYFGREYALVRLEGVIGSVNRRTRWV